MSASVGGSPARKRGLRPCVGAIEIDALHEDAMEMEIHIERTAKALDKRDRSRVHLARSAPRVTAWLT